MSNIIVPKQDVILLNDPADIRSPTAPTASDLQIRKRCLATLHKHYPGASWRVNVSSYTGVINVFCLELSSRWGEVIYLARAYVDPDLRCVMLAGGSLLERAKRARGRWDEEHPVGCVEGIRPQDQPINGVAI